MKHWHLEISDQRIATLTFDQLDARVNSLSVETVEELDEALNLCVLQAPVGLLIRSGKRSGFIAGADVKAFPTFESAEQVRTLIRRTHQVLSRLETLDFPSVAMIHGFCLGGGLELALACTRSVVSDASETRLAFPEIRLGIFPGFGGTARAVSRVGHLAAMNLMLTGRPLSGEAARRLGLVDECVPVRHLETAALARLKCTHPRRSASWWRRIPGWRPLRPLVAAALRRQAGSRANPAHYPAPGALIDHWQAHGSDPDALAKGEIETVPELLTGAAARNLIRAFLLRERLRAPPVADGWQPRHLHVIGAGVMGSDIATWAALCGLRVSLQDRDVAPVARAMARAGDFLERRLRDPLRIREALDRLIPDIRGEGLHHADVVLEAIIEDSAAKRAVYRELLPRMKAQALLATNTSSIPLETLGGGLAHSGRLVGLHFFNPVAKMPLLEIVRGEATAPLTLRRARTLALLLDKVPVEVRSSPGFLVNRILMRYLLEAVLLYEDGIPPATVDRAATDFGMPVGPLELADIAGLDVCLSVARELSGLLQTGIPESLRQRVEAGRLGRKTGAGYYRWPRARRSLGPRVPYTPEQQDRLVLPLVNEAVACLREGVVASADELDGAVVFGTGFAPFRGGPLRHLQDVGAAVLHARLRQLQRYLGDRFRPDAGWDHWMRGEPP